MLGSRRAYAGNDQMAGLSTRGIVYSIDWSSHGRMTGQMVEQICTRRGDMLPLEISLLASSAWVEGEDNRLLPGHQDKWRADLEALKVPRSNTEGIMQANGREIPGLAGGPLQYQARRSTQRRQRSCSRPMGSTAYT